MRIGAPRRRVTVDDVFGRAPRKLGLLIGVGTAICGGTAIAVTAPVVEADESETASP